MWNTQQAGAGWSTNMAERAGLTEKNAQNSRQRDSSGKLELAQVKARE